ncbi:hypothetical protein A6V06_22830 [Escherichia coli]|nr:hypothetical protein A6V06_22830 [Escherichia coli]
MLPSETMIWQPEFTDKTLSRKPGAVQSFKKPAIRWLLASQEITYVQMATRLILLHHVCFASPYYQDALAHVPLFNL